MFLLETSIDETAPRSLKTPRSDCSPLRHHLEGTPTCGKFVGPKPAGYKIFSDGYCLRLLSRVPRQARRVPVHAQLLRAPRPEFVLRQHARDLRRQSPQHHVRRVHHKPVRAFLQRFGFFTFGYVRPHRAQSHLSLLKQTLILEFGRIFVNEELRFWGWESTNVGRRQLR